tara:strand:+ start:647 stop:2623 length:1977 start_codon:yes stop_codon:yes gene_type:complete
MAGILGAQNEVEARRKAAEEAKADVAFGQNFSDTLGGYGTGALNYLRGGINDYAGLLAGIGGYEDFATKSNLRSDEFYRRGGEFFDQGLAGGNTYLNEKSMPLDREEKIAKENAEIFAAYDIGMREKEFLKNANLFEGVDAGVDSSLQSGKPNISFTRKEGESTEDFKNRIIKEQSVTAGAPASRYDEVPSELTGQSAYELQSTIDALTASGGKGRGQTNEQQGERAAFAKEQARKNDPMGDYSGEEPTVDLFMQAMADGNVAEGKEQPKAESREDMLEKYKQEFADATGIDISGKPDNSQALMAMGLSMMKNRAGKGFNIGNMLSAVGDAGEKAMPYVAKAASEAKAASASAGKYALGRIQAGEASAAAFAKELRAHNRAYDLEKYKLEEQYKLEELKQKGKKGELKSSERISVGGNKDLKLGLARSGDRLVFATPAQDAANISSAYVKYTDGLDNVDVMRDALSNIAAAQGGAALKRLKDSAGTLAVTFGLADPETLFGEGGISDANKFKVYQQATINAFKKLILQESQVSNLDLTTLFASFGEVGFMDSPQKANAAIDKMMDYMMTKRNALQPFIEDFYNEDMYLNTEDYNNTQKKLEVFGVQPPSRASSGEGGRMSLDLATLAPFRNPEGQLVNPNINVGDSGQLKYTSPSKTG